MASPYDYSSILATQPSGGMADVVRSAIFGQQQQQQNQGVLDEQARANQARQIQGQIVANPNMGDDEFSQHIGQMAQFDPAAAQAMRAQRQQQQRATSAWNDVVKDPSATNVGKYMLAVPEQAKAFQEGWGVLNQAQKDSELRTAADVTGALNAGKSDIAKQIMTARRDADSKAGQDTAHWDTLLKLVDDDPAHSKALANIIMAQMAGPEKFAEAYGKMGEEGRAAEKQPAAVQQAQAEADIKTTEAGAKPAMIKSELATADAQRKRWAAQTATDIANANTSAGRLSLDVDALETNTAIKLQELGQAGVKLDPASTGIMNASAGAAVAADQLAAKEAALAARVRTSGAWSGPFASVSNGLKNILGTQDDVYSQLRAEWTQLKNSQALANRKDMPGAMSDADREFLLKGFPPDNASPEYIAHFLEAMSKAQKVVSISEDRKASWIGANGNLSPAKGDVSINGTLVPKGTTFAEFMRGAAKVDNRGALPNTIGALAQKYGGAR